MSDDLPEREVWGVGNGGQHDPEGPIMPTRRPDDLSALAEALRRGNRSRLLVLVCAGERGCRLGSVYGTRRGPVLLATVAVTYMWHFDDGGIGWHPNGGSYFGDGAVRRHHLAEGYRRDRSARGHDGAVILDDCTDYPRARLDVSCRCRTVRVRAGYLRGALSARRRRVVITGKDTGSDFIL